MSNFNNTYCESSVDSPSFIIIGLVADAASLGLHWIYDQDALLTALNTKGVLAQPEFFPPMNKYYTHEDGEFTPYGHELYAVLKSLAEQGGHVDGEALAKDLASYYKSQVTSNHYLNKSSKAVLENVVAGKAFPDTALAADAQVGWLLILSTDQATLGTKMSHTGSFQTQANSFVKAPAVVALKAGKSDLASSLKTAITVQQSDEAAVSAGVVAGLILDKVIQGDSIQAAVTWALSDDSGVSPTSKEDLRVAISHSGAAFSEVAKRLGLSCGLPSSLQCSILSAMDAPSYVEGVRANIVAGGDSASRNVLVGALLAAQHGLDSVPQGWKNKAKHYAEAESLVDKLLASR